MSTHNIWFLEEIRKNIYLISPFILSYDTARSKRVCSGEGLKWGL